MSKLPLIKIKNGEKLYLKLTKDQRVQHLVLMLSFTTCVVTGLPLKFYSSPISRTISDFFGGPINMGIVHKISGTIMLLLFVYHVFYIGKQLNKFYVRPARAVEKFSILGLVKYIYYSPVFPRVKDIKDVINMFKYYLFLSDEHPKHERFYWREKFDYLAVFWGINILGITGIILWQKGFFLQYLPEWAFSITTIVHSFEALLATADIIVWHMYNAHCNYDKFPASTLFLTGYLPENILKHEYYLEWQRINRLVEKDPSLMFNEDEYKANQHQRNIDQYQDTIDYIDLMAEASSVKSKGADHE